MSTTRVVLYNCFLGQNLPLDLITKQIVAFLMERNIAVLNQNLLICEFSSQLFEQSLSVIKKADLGIFILNSNNLLQTFILSQMLYRKTKCLVFINNDKLYKQIRTITYANLYSYQYKTLSDITNTLKLFGL